MCVRKLHLLKPRAICGQEAFLLAEFQQLVGSARLGYPENWEELRFAILISCKVVHVEVVRFLI